MAGITSVNGVAHLASTDPIDHRHGIVWRVVASPSDVAVGPHQYEPCFIDSCGFGVVDRLDFDGHTPRFRGLDDPLVSWRFLTKSRQHKPAAIKVQRRTAIRESDMRGSTARTRRWLPPST